MLVRSVGLFLTGLLLGLTLGANLLAPSPSTNHLQPGCQLGAGGAGTAGELLFTLRWPRPFTVLGTALLGAAVLVACAYSEVLALGMAGLTLAGTSSLASSLLV